ncbi:hypothetical protein Lal_00036727 [Lupinus albus]|nr:hypothetical protein Lal_00036727 [Lupinus albus]
MITKDLLAIPISIVASESAFSTSGRFLTPHHSRLRPHTLEALMFFQDWLWTDVKGDDIDDDDVSKFIDVLIYKEPIDPCVVDEWILDI